MIRPLSTAVRTTYKKAIYESLFELIQNLELPPGERLVEADLASRFGVSKTPIREALLVLERDRLVTMVPHVGATVTWLSLDDYEQQLFILDALEQPALKLIVERATRAELQSCAKLVEGMQEARTKRDAHEYLRLALRWHGELFATARYPRLTQLINLVQRSLRRYTTVFVHQFDDSWDREMKIITCRFDYLVKGDAISAAAAVQSGHAALLEIARRKVRERHPLVMKYLARPSAETHSHIARAPLRAPGSGPSPRGRDGTLARGRD